jgi:PBP1b-binding outer membrane lipoprotein LpoB
MIKNRFFLIVLAAVILSGCSVQPIGPESQEAEPAAVTESTATANTPSPSDNTATECPGAEINPIGDSIAADYAFTTYDQVMAWFCEGAEFEDILVALETEALTDEPAGEMLQMIADGLTWEDVWILIDLDD